MIEWPEMLIEDIARRHAVIYIGSGISANALSADGLKRPPTWEAFLREALDSLPEKHPHIVEAIDRHEYLDACEWIKRRLDDRWIPLLRAQFVEPRYKAAEIHRDIFELDTRFVLTTNFDKIYDGYAESSSDGTTIVKSYTNTAVADLFRLKARTILKVHGTIDDPGEMIFTRSDYARARVKHEVFYRTLDALVLTNTFLFLGCGISDPDLQLFLERYRYAHTPSQPHYMAMPGPPNEDIRISLREQLNLKLLTYDNANRHLELQQSLAELVRKVETARDRIAGDQSW